MKILTFSLMMSLMLTLLTVGITATTTNMQTAEAKQNISDCNDDDPDTFCTAGGGRAEVGAGFGSGGFGGRCEYDFSQDIVVECSGGSGGHNIDPEFDVGGGGGQAECDPGCEKTVGGEGRHFQGEGDEGSEDN